MTTLVLWAEGDVMFAEVDGPPPQTYVMPATDTETGRHANLTFEHVHTYESYHHYQFISIEYDQP